MTPILRKAIIFLILACTGCISGVAQSNIPEQVSRRLLNDLHVTVAQTPTLGDSMTIGLVVRYGAAFDPEGKGGLAYLVSRMMTQAAANMTFRDIQAEMERLGVSIEVRCDWDSFRFLLRGRSEVWEKALLLLYRIVCEARFEDADFAAVKRTILEELQKAPDPRKRIHSQLEKVLFQGTTYGRSLTGTTESVNALTPGDVRFFYKRFFSPGQAALQIVGNLKPEAVHPRVARIWGAWVRADDIPFTFAQPKSLAGREIYVDDDPESTAVQFIIGGLFPRREEASYIDAILAARILQDRLNKLLPISLLTVANEGRRLSGPFYIQGQAAADQAIAQILDVQSAIEDMKRNPVTEEELVVARQELIQNFKQNFESTDGLCNLLLDAELYRLGSNYLSFFPDRIQRSDVGAVRKAASSWILPDGELLLIRGPLFRLKTGLNRMGTVHTLPYER